MKSAVPKVLHQVCGLPMIEHVLRSGDALRPASTTVVVGHGADLVRDKLATRPSVSLVVQEPQLGTGHALLQAERPWPDAAERWWCCPATLRFSDLARSSAWSTRIQQRAQPQRFSRRVWPIPPGTDESSGRMAPSCRSSSIETRARRSAGSAKSTAASTLSISSCCSRRYAPSAQRTRRGSITCRTSSACIASAGSASRRWFSTIPREILGVNSRSELAVVSAHLRDRKNEELMAAGVTIVDPAANVDRTGRFRGAGQRSASRRLPSGANHHRRAVRAPVQRAYRGQRARRRRVREQLLRDRRVAGEVRRANRSLRAPPTRSRTSGRMRTSETSSSSRRPFWDADRKPIISPIWAMRRSARRSTSVPARSRATTTASRRTRRSSRTEPSSAATASSWRPCESAKARTSRRDHRSPGTCRPVRSGSRAGRRSTKRAGSSVARAGKRRSTAPEQPKESDTMCGIIGYIGPQRVLPILIDGLRRLEYRGYDSAGVAVVRNGAIELRRSAGKLSNLEDVIATQPLEGDYGIGHTRWATHGRPTEENAHPHRDCSGRIVVVHNGIIENYLDLKHAAAEGRAHVRHRDGHRDRRAPRRARDAGRRSGERGAAFAALPARPLRARAHLGRRSEQDRCRQKRAADRRGSW